MLTYERLRNMAVLVNAVAFFTAVVLGTRIKLEILATHPLKAAKRLFGIPDFRLYALADGIREVCRRLDYGFRPVRLPEQPDVPLRLVVLRGLGEKPMMLLTNLSLRKNRKVLWWVVSAYLNRWRIEEAIRFIKQSYDLEDIRVLETVRISV